MLSSAGTRPKRIPVSKETAAVNPKTRRSLVVESWSEMVSEGSRAISNPIGPEREHQSQATSNGG